MAEYNGHNVLDMPVNRRNALKAAMEVAKADNEELKKDERARWDKYLLHDSIDELLDGLSPTDIAEKCYYGGYKPGARWYRYDSNGNIEPVTEEQAMSEAWIDLPFVIEWSYGRLEIPVHTILSELVTETPGFITDSE